MFDDVEALADFVFGLSARLALEIALDEQVFVQGVLAGLFQGANYLVTGSDWRDADFVLANEERVLLDARRAVSGYLAINKSVAAVSCLACANICSLELKGAFVGGDSESLRCHIVFLVCFVI